MQELKFTSLNDFYAAITDLPIGGRMSYDRVTLFCQGNGLYNIINYSLTPATPEQFARLQSSLLSLEWKIYILRKDGNFSNIHSSDMVNLNARLDAGDVFLDPGPAQLGYTRYDLQGNYSEQGYTFPYFTVITYNEVSAFNLCAVIAGEIEEHLPRIRHEAQRRLLAQVDLLRKHYLQELANLIVEYLA